MDRLKLVWNRKEYAQTVLPPRLYCLLCGDTGKMLAIKRDKPALPYAFVCTCSSGDRWSGAWPRWGSSLDKDYVAYVGMVEWEVK